LSATAEFLVVLGVQADGYVVILLHCALSLAAQCIVIGPVCVCLCVCGSTRNCVHRLHQTGFVGKGSDHLQLIKFWPSCAPGKGVCGGAKFGTLLITFERKELSLQIWYRQRARSLTA